jgi:hypothetical protein
MAGKSGPDIAENSIQLYLDAKNDKSYRGDAVWSDLSGNANSGSLYTGKCLSYGGTGYISFDSRIFDVADDGTIDNLTISIWFNQDAQVAGHKELVSWWETGGQTYSDGFLGTTNYDTIRFGDDWASIDVGVLTINTWYHIIAVKTSTDAYIYLNGSLVATKGSSLSFGFNDVFVIGRQHAAGEVWDGQMSDVKLFNTNLSADNISELYNNPNLVLPTGISGSQLVGHWPLSEGDGTIAHDGSGNQNHGTLSGSAIPTWVSGSTDIPQLGGKSYNKPMVFDGSDDYISVGATGTLDFISNNSDFTIGLWIYIDEFDGTSRRFLGNREVTSPYDGYTFNHGRLTNSWRKINFQVTKDGTRYGANFSSELAVEKQWHHVTATWSDSGNNVVIYLNGTDVSQGNNATTETSDDNLNIGRGAGSYFNGKLDEVAFWNIILDPTSIALLAATGSNGTPLPPDATTISGSNLVGYWRNDGDTTWTDRSGNGNDGTVNGSPDSIFLPEGIYADRDSQGFHIKEPNTGWITFDGIADYINCGNDSSLDLSESISVGFWVYWTGTGEEVIYSNGTTEVNGALLQTRGSTNLRIINDNTDGNYYYKDTSAGTFVADQWTHVAYTYDHGSTTLNIYVDSILIDTDTSGTATSRSTTNSIIGKASWSTRFWDGKIAQPIIYSRALSQAEITQNFNAMKSRYGK